MPAAPLVTIITPLLNRAGMLPDALASVAAQQPTPFEHLAIDGGSHDGSQDIAAAAGAQVISAPGSSIYEAINIGLVHARGEFFCLLNSDDRLAPGALAAGLEAFATDPNLEIVRGRAGVERYAEGRWTETQTVHTDPTPSLRDILLGASNINACLFRSALVERIGAFDSGYAIAADREWLARAIVRGARAKGLDQVLYYYRTHAGSLTIGENRPAAVRWVREHLSFARAMLCDRTIERRHRALVQAFHAKETAHLLALAVAGGGLMGNLPEVAKSFRASPFWPVHAVAPLVSIALRRLR